MGNYFSATPLLTPPLERVAFSDRQAYVCAELSRLAYFKFEGGHTLDEVLAVVKDFFGTSEKIHEVEKKLTGVLSQVPSTPTAARDALAVILSGAGFQLVDVIDIKGCEGFFCTKTTAPEVGTSKTLAYLVFRGTEPKDFEDIKSDANAAPDYVPIDGETLCFHGGYYRRYKHVEEAVRGLIEGTKYDQLILTGHSLGGALAQVTTRLLVPNVNGACYTFGAPPIGAASIQNKLKTPIYEIINEIDIVPRLPNPWLAGMLLLLVKGLRLLAKIVIWIDKILLSSTLDEKIEKLLEALLSYRHPGYQSYLVGSGDNAQLRFNVSPFDRLRWFTGMHFKRWFFLFKKMVGDHSIEVYVEKLRVHAMKRL